MKFNILNKIIGIFSFTCIILLNLTLFLNPIEGYEISIYCSLPFISWIFLISAIIGGILLIFIKIYVENNKKNNFWLIGFLILIVCRINLLIIPFIRGYYTWTDDHLSHVGLVKDIIIYGHFYENNFYPISHILSSFILQISNISTISILNYLPPFFSGLYIIFTFLLSSLINNKKISLLLVSLLAPVIFNAYDLFFTPNGLSLLLLPIFLYSLFKSEKSFFFNIILLIFIIIFPFFHPLTSIVVIFILIIYNFNDLFFKKITNKNFSFIKNATKYKFSKIILISIIYISWLISFNTYKIKIQSIINSFSSNNEISGISEIITDIGKLNIQSIEFISLIIKLYGEELIFLSLSFLLLLFLLKKIFCEKKSDNVYKFLSFFILIIGLFSVMYIIYLSGFLSLLKLIASERLIRIIIIFTPIPSAFIVYKLLINKNKKIIYPILILLLILSSSILGMISIFPSPIIYNPNPQINKADIYGYSWNFDHRQLNTNFAIISTKPSRFHSVIYGTNITLKNKISMQTFQIPDHFNFNNSKNILSNYYKKSYFINPIRDEILYDTAWKKVDRFDNKDFIELNNRIEVNLIYNNPNEIYIIYK